MKHSLSFEKVTHNISRRFEWVALVAFALMSAACSENSDTNSTNEPACGNGILDEAEMCDGNILSYEASCPKGKHLPSGANYSCNADCTLNTDVCVSNSTEPIQSCGNGTLDDGEICDGELSKEASCPEGTHLPTDASLSCNADCSLNTDVCVPNQEDPIERCGNGILDEDEACDGEQLSESASCPEGMHLGEGNSLACNADCTLDTSACEINASTTIPQGRVQADEANPDVEAIQLHRTPQDVFPNEDLYAEREDEPSQIITKLPVGAVVDIMGAVGDRWLVQYNEFEGYIHSRYIQRINELEIPEIDYSSSPSPNYSQFDPRWKDVPISNYTLEQMGGGPVSAADAIAAIKKDDSITPDKVAEKMTPTFGTSKDHLCRFVQKEYQLECEYIDNTDGMNCGSNTKKDPEIRNNAKEKIQDAFKHGWYIVAEEGDESASYWGTNRNVLLYGYDSSKDRLYFDDPRNLHYMYDGMESFLDCSHSLSIIKDRCVPKTCADLGPECGELSDGCGGTLNCACTPKGTVINDNTEYRRSPQNKFSAPNFANELLNSTHTSGLNNGQGEPAQIAGKLNKGTEVNILGKVPATSMTPEWYQVTVGDNKENYYILASELKTNGVEIKVLPYFAGATTNYAQGDSRWAGESYPHGNLASDGCGPSSIANALATLTGNDTITPLTIAKELKNVGAANYDGGGTWSDNRMCTIPTFQNNNINCTAELKTGNTKQKMIDMLKAGGYVVVLHQGSTSYWTNAGHYITVYGYDEKYFFADDPMGRRYYQNADDFMKTTVFVAYISKK